MKNYLSSIFTKSNITKIAIHFAVVIFAVMFLLIGNRIAAAGIENIFQNNEHNNSVFAEIRVTQIIEILEESNEWSNEYDVSILFQGTVLEGETLRRGQSLFARQLVDGAFSAPVEPVEVGDRVFVVLDEHEFAWVFLDYSRTSPILALGIVLVALMLLFGNIKGLNAIVSLGYTCAVVFAVLIPAILTGRNIYATTIIVSLFLIFISLFLIYGVNKKSLAAAAGCFGGVLAAGLLAYSMNAILKMSGMLDSESLILWSVHEENPIELRGVIFAGIVIGALGAIMDVAVSIASSLTELKSESNHLVFRQVIKSGINIGRDIMGSMTNTLVLAYIGSSLSTILLLYVYNTDTLGMLLSGEFVAVELLQAIIGSIGILLAIPITTLVCAVFYGRVSVSQLQQ
ncbi:MAG: YibE/F family protein [Oscillospiraceae bacterium]|nr:YibE/F family protein [Oscillospiraceae bacterium]